MKLTGEQQFKIKKMLQNDIQFIAGTTAPATADVLTQDIESISCAVQYYAEKFAILESKGVAFDKCYTMIAEPKYMGSRATFYIDRDINKCMATSRSGIKLNVTKLGLTEVFEANQWILDEFNADRVIVDGELLPWAVLGAGLIEKEFKTVPLCVKAEHAFLKNSNFEEQFNALVKSEEYVSFLKEQTQLSKKELTAKYRLYETYKNLQEIKFDIDLSLDESKIEQYSKQIELYGQYHAPVFKPFNLLKSYHSGEEKVWVWEDQSLIYQKLSQHQPDIEKGVVFYVKDIPSAVIQLTEYFEKLEQMGYEGMVIKPVFNHMELLPYMKVRNKEYLRIIYGYDYDTPKKLAHLVNKKRCNKKRRLSLIEWQLGNELLSCQDENRKKEIMASILFEIEAEQEVDCRL